ncbi:MAG: DUF4249 domain-containing protein [Flavobacteriaceae bacterium]|nr:DUF4249 domain-containing protein [Flavobacteriaceae bacterium]
MRHLRFLFIGLILIVSCEDPIRVDLDTEAPRLVIDASINWFKGTPGNDQSIKLSLSAPYFNSVNPPANDAIVSIFDGNNTAFTFLEDGDSGIYKNSNFTPELEQTYVLTIVYDNEIYTGTETFIPVVPFDFIEQSNTGGFSGEDIEIKAYYTDPLNEENFYFFEFISDIPIIPTLEVYEDRFTNGNQIFGYYTEEDLASGDVVTVRNYGISEQFYAFMFILLQQNSEEGGGPFETQPATVRGNCVNTTNPDNFPLGYFRLSEVDEIDYTVQ